MSCRVRDQLVEQELIYEKLPKDIADRHVLLMDPILATGNSAARAIQARSAQQRIFPSIVGHECWSCMIRAAHHSHVVIRQMLPPKTFGSRARARSHSQLLPRLSAGAAPNSISRVWHSATVRGTPYAGPQHPCLGSSDAIVEASSVSANTIATIAFVASGHSMASMPEGFVRGKASSMAGLLPILKPADQLTATLVLVASAYKK